MAQAKKHEKWQLRSMQSADLNTKILLTKTRIREWVKVYGEDGVYVSFSGGKDSTVLLHIVRSIFPNVPAVFVDVPTQYPELKQFAQSFENVVILKPKTTFAKVCENYGFPLISKEVSGSVHEARKYLTEVRGMSTGLTDRQTVKGYWAIADVLGIDRRQGAKKSKEYQDLKKGIIPNRFKYGAPIRFLQLIGEMPEKKDGELTGNYSKRYDKSRYKNLLDAPFEVSNECCKVMKKTPLYEYGRKTKRVPFTAQMADESALRESTWLRHGCNMFDAKHPTSNPMAFWLEQDVLRYIKENNLPICSVYGDVVEDLSGTDDVENQLTFSDYGFDKQWDAPNKPLKTTGCSRTGCMLCGFGCHIEKSPNRFELLKETHPKMYALLDVVKNNGVTMREAIEWLNENCNTNIRL